MNQYIEEAEQHLLHTYNRFPVIFEKGKDVYLYDKEGKEYLDFVSGIAVFALGYGNEEYNNTLKEQIDKIIHTSNYFYNMPAIEAAKRLTGITGLDRVFFTNSGAEAIEGALKAARKYAFLKDQQHDHEIIAMKHSFHGRTMGALSVTGNPNYQEAFLPLIGQVKFAEYNNLASVQGLINEKTCAIILETVQGEGGIYPAHKEFLVKIRELCTEKDILLILDEIQCGMGRTGSLFAYQQYGIMPDILTTAKALGCGVPVGAFLMTEKVAQNSLTSGDHGTTYGGNPLATAAINKVLDLFDKYNIIDNVTKVGGYLAQKLDELVEDYPMILERRGIGLMQGLVFDKPVNPILTKALEHGLVLINAGTNVIRFVPPLIITEKHVDKMLSILKECIE